MEVLGLASPLEDAESCVYGYGALKFLTMNTVLLAKVLKLGILELMVLHMKIVNTAVSCDITWMNTTMCTVHGLPFGQKSLLKLTNITFRTGFSNCNYCSPK